MYGENAFTIRPAVFQSDIDRAKKAKQVRMPLHHSQLMEMLHAGAAVHRGAAATPRLLLQFQPVLTTEPCIG